MPGHPDPEITGGGGGGGGAKNIFLGPFRSQFGLKIVVHPPLIFEGRHLCQERNFRNSYGSENLRSKSLIKSNDLLGSRTCLY